MRFIFFHSILVLFILLLIFLLYKYLIQKENLIYFKIQIFLILIIERKIITENKILSVILIDLNSSNEFNFGFSYKVDSFNFSKLHDTSNSKDNHKGNN